MAGCWLLSLETNIAPATIMQPISTATMSIIRYGLPSVSPQHCLYFIPLPQVQRLFRPFFMFNSFFVRGVERSIFL